MGDVGYSLMALWLVFVLMMWVCYRRNRRNKKRLRRGLGVIIIYGGIYSVSLLYLRNMSCFYNYISLVSFAMIPSFMMVIYPYLLDENIKLRYVLATVLIFLGISIICSVIEIKVLQEAFVGLFVSSFVWLVELSMKKYCG
nr:MAG TPA: Chloroquine resistance transporter [Caudoviricetes sp.]